LLHGKGRIEIPFNKSQLNDFRRKLTQAERDPDAFPLTCLASLPIPYTEPAPDPAGWHAFTDEPPLGDLSRK
jgi:hypothetical protein